MKHSVLIVQAISYRIIVIILDTIVLFFVMGDPWKISAIVLVRHLIQTVLHWLHEVAWLHSSWGMTVQGDASHLRTLCKTITFRLLASGKDMIVLYLFTQDLIIATQGMLLISLLNTIAYYVHDRYWNAKQRIPVRLSSSSGS